MAARQSNIEIITPPNGTTIPSCSHGPTLLFERYDQASKRLRQFFACSAFRDKKECSFHQWVDDDLTISQQPRSTNSSHFSHRKLRKRFREFRKLPRKERCVCCTCGLLLLPAEVCDHRELGHSLRERVALADLRRPSFLFKALDDNKTYAQYLFSSKAVNFLLTSIKSLDFAHVLCVGAPRIHEEIQSRRKEGDLSLNSMLLDLDERYAQLYPPSQFGKYNMFNHHFFESHGEMQVKQFLSEDLDKVLLLTDPPFGGMVEALAQSFLKIGRLLSERISSLKGAADVQVKDMPLIWIFPYFMENRIVEHLPSMVMLDYKVDYDNHNLFNNQHKKKGSPVRIFTNISPDKFVLPRDEGYRFCEPCQRYSSSENQHCKDCKACPSKDGTTYVHCDACLRCVKPSRVHCYKCQMCVLPAHQCGRLIKSGCHICGEEGHKRRDCPKRYQRAEKSNKSLKRKLQTPKQQKRKKRKS